MNRTILYLHGMGGGTDSRIPGILQEHFASADPSIRVVCRTYDFDPAVAHPVIRAWVDELHPDLIIGESLGATHALRIPEIPKLLVSPALGGPMRLVRLAPWTLIPGVGWICRRFIWHVKRPGRQVLRFRYRILNNYRDHYEAMLSLAKDSTDKPWNDSVLQPALDKPWNDSVLPPALDKPWNDSVLQPALDKPWNDADVISSEVEKSPLGYVHAFIGDNDHYKKSGVVSNSQWENLYGPYTYTTYPGTHFMEEEYIHTLLIPRIKECLSVPVANK